MCTYIISFQKLDLISVHYVHEYGKLYQCSHLIAHTKTQLIKMIVNGHQYETVFKIQKSRLLERARGAPERLAEQPNDAELVEGLASCAEAAIAAAGVPPRAAEAEVAEEEGGGSTSSSSARSSSHSSARAARRVASRSVQVARPACGRAEDEEEDEGGSAEAPGSASANTASSGGRFSSCVRSNEEELIRMIVRSRRHTEVYSLQYGRKCYAHFDEQKARANELEAEHWASCGSASVQLQRIETRELKELE